jgi:AcrR family transcriptional regulator
MVKLFKQRYMSEKKEQLNRKDIILNTARQLFSISGYEKTTVNEIAHKAGIAKGSIYLEFESKEEILHEIIERFATTTLDGMEEKISLATPPYLPKIKNIVLENALNIFNMANSQMKTHITLIHTNYQIKQKLHHIFERRNIMLAEIFKKAAMNNEIIPVTDYIRLAQILVLATSAFYPPYDFKYSSLAIKMEGIEKVKARLNKDAGDVIDILLKGLTVHQEERPANET